MSARYAAPRGNKYAAPCRVCGQTVAPGEGHYSRTAGVIHAPQRWVGSPISGKFVGGCPPRDPDDTPSTGCTCGPEGSGCAICRPERWG